MDSSDDVVEMTFTRLNSKRHPPSEACLAFMAAHDLDPSMPVFRAAVSTVGMMKFKADRPDVANIMQLLTGPFGIVDARPVEQPFRVAQLQVGDNVLDVEAEYEWPGSS
jgi:hypothetical protein